MRAPSPALVISVIALFAALGGGAAAASGLIPGKRIEDHSIPAKKLTDAAVKALHGVRGPAGPQGQTGVAGPQGPKGDTGATGSQGPGAISINMGDVPADNAFQLLRAIGGLAVYYNCYPTGVLVELEPQDAGGTVFASGDMAQDGTLTSLQKSSNVGIDALGNATVNLDAIAWVASNGTLSRFDLGGYHGATGCNIWGLITPGSAS